MSDPNMDKQKGFSLRKQKERRPGPPGMPPTEGKNRYPPQDRPRGDGRPSGDGQSRSQQRPQARRNDNTAATLQKRFSMRYNAPPDLGLGAPPVPGMPQMPSQIIGDDGRNGGPPRGIMLDKRRLGDPNFRADEYIAKYLTSASESDISDFKSKLKSQKNRGSLELQKNIVQNRAQFIKISKDTEQLKDEMQSLKTLMSDLTTTLGQQAASMDANSFDDGARKRANRSSLANLEVMWNNQLQILWKNIEGSQKFLAAIPGRHVLSESGHWAALDAATWKSRGPIHVVLLNDHLLIAAKKRKRVDTDNPNNQRAHSKLVAVKCWPLEEIQLVDVLNEGEVSSKRRGQAQVASAISVRSDRETYTFCSERGKTTDKTELLTQFRRAKDELRRTQRADNKDADVKSKERADYLATRDPAISRSAGLLRTLSKTKERADMLIIDTDGTPRNLRWVEGQIDELDIEIALQRFDEAVTLLERLRNLAQSLKGNTVAQEIITVKVDERATKLADMLTRNLALNHAQLNQTQVTISHLNRLDFSAQARQTYLNARTSVIHARARQCVFEGDVLAHITNISYVYFTLMKNTIATYQQCFPHTMMSACMVWAKSELDKYNDALGRALSGVEKNGEVWTEGLQRARELAGDLAEVGVDFEGMVGAEL